MTFSPMGLGPRITRHHDIAAAVRQSHRKSGRDKLISSSSSSPRCVRLRESFFLCQRFAAHVFLNGRAQLSGFSYVHFLGGLYSSLFSHCFINFRVGSNICPR